MKTVEGKTTKFSAEREQNEKFSTAQSYWKSNIESSEGHSVFEYRSFEMCSFIISHEDGWDVDSKILQYQRVYGTINRRLERQFKRETAFKFYKVMAVSSLLYVSEA